MAKDNFERAFELLEAQGNTDPKLLLMLRSMRESHLRLKKNLVRTVDKKWWSRRESNPRVVILRIFIATSLFIDLFLSDLRAMTLSYQTSPNPFVILMFWNT